MHDVPYNFFFNLLKAISNVSELRLNLETDSQRNRRSLTLQGDMPQLRKLHICFPDSTLDVLFALRSPSLECLSLGGIIVPKLLQFASVKTLSLLDEAVINRQFGADLNVSSYFPSLNCLQVPAYDPYFREDFLRSSRPGLNRILCIKIDLLLDDFQTHYDVHLVQFLMDLPNVVEIALKINNRRAYMLRDLVYSR